MKKKVVFFVVFITIFGVFLQNMFFNVIFAEKKKDENLELYQGEIVHLFTHCLLAYPSVALSSSNPMRKDYDRDCITPDEFLSILQNLYDRDYILIDINKTFKEENGVVKKAEMYLPKGKKPLIFSFDDVNYDSKKIGKGMVDKLIVKDGEIFASTKINGKEEIKNDNEFVCILESFVEKNPDFSFQGARGTLCLTGFDGVLGYRTSSRNKVNRKEEIAKAKKVVKVLKDKGWNFACHSFGHYHMKKISFEKFEEEVNLWNLEVKPIIGETALYVYPYGEWEIYDDEYNFSKKHKLLLQNGFKLFCGVGIQNFYSFVPYQTKDKPKSLFMDRKPIDGFTLRNKKAQLSSLFCADEVLDLVHRSKV